MLRLYKESGEFNEYSVFDTDKGELKVLAHDEFRNLMQQHPERIQLFEAKPGSRCTGFPRRIYFQITHQCNLNCSYCFIKANATASHLPFKVIKDVARLTGERGLMEVRLSGGEPTMHPDFINIYKEFRENNVYVSVATNGIWTEPIKEFFITEMISGLLLLLTEIKRHIIKTEATLLTGL
ncbi:MAG: radical SAM protein [Chitinophagaceae bacterium]|nr:radical SAM protein [Chitinophagaceae bacterium]